MTSSTTTSTTITKGMRLTDFANLDLTVEETASGGMGLVVWGPNAARGGQMTALKLLRPDRLAEAAAISRQARAESERQFEEEALVWCHLWAHQSVITADGLTRLTGLGDLPVLVLEYAPHGSLRRRLHLAQQQRQPLPLRATLAWALHIATALAHLHHGDAAHDRAALTRMLQTVTPSASRERPTPLVHCDLKPENVLLDEQNWALLTDLGLTRAYATLDAQVAATATAAQSQQSGRTAPTAQQARAEEVVRLRAVLQVAGKLPLPTIDRAALLATRTLRVAPTQALAPGAEAGASRVTRIGSGIGSRGPVAGSPPYMAPEQWLGLDTTTPATDLYAFGVLLFELFAGYAAPFPFPRDPTPYLTPALYTHALMMGYDPLLLAWHAAHTRQPLPAEAAAQVGPVDHGAPQAVHRLTDPAMRAAALASGPCAELVAQEEQARALACLEQIGELVEACLAGDPADRPSAAQIVERLQALASNPCGLEPLQVPKPLSITPESEAAFWGNLGVTYSKLGREPEAIAAKRQALKHNPTDPLHWHNLAASFGQFGQQERRKAREAQAAGRGEEADQLRAAARRHFEEELDADRQAQRHLTPEVVAEWPILPASLASNEANALSNLERYAEAVDADERALSFDPEKHNIRFNLALHLAYRSQEAGASVAEQVARLERAQREIARVLAAAPEMIGGRSLAADIAQALADPAHRFRR